MVARISKIRYFWVLRLIVLSLLSVAISGTVAQYVHEFGHLIVALVTGSTIDEYVFWPPWQQHVDVTSQKIIWIVPFTLGGFIISVILFSALFVFYVHRKSKWAYLCIFPLFQTLVSSYGDLKSVGVDVPVEIVLIFAWFVPVLVFGGLAWYCKEWRRVEEEGKNDSLQNSSAAESSR